MTDQRRSDFHVVFTMSLRTWIKTIINKFAISNHTALILGLHALKSYLRLICEYQLHSLPNKKVSSAKGHGNNYITVRPSLIRRLLGNFYSSTHAVHYHFLKTEFPKNLAKSARENREKYDL